MFKMIRNRIVSGIMAAVMTISHITPIVPISAEETSEYSSETEMTEMTEATEERVLTQQSIELYPNGEVAEQIITLDGMMPEGAEAEAVDVSEDYEGVAAYDISISSEGEDYQPGEENPILVEITDPVITESIELWHIHDDGYREQIFDFTVEEGKVSFYATGFSVYEIVKNEDAAPIDGLGWNRLKTIAALAEYCNKGIYISTASTSTGRFVSGSQVSISSTRTGIYKTKNAYTVNDGVSNNDAVTDENKAVPYYFEDYTISADGKTATCYIYCLGTDGETKKYVYNGGNNSLGFGDKTLFLISVDNSGSFTIKNNDSSWYWNEQGESGYNKKGNDKENVSIACYSSATKMYFYQYTPIENDDPYHLDNTSYGLMNYTGSTKGYALIASEDESVHPMVELITHPSGGSSRTLYVDEGKEVTIWTFTNKGEDNYTLSAETGSALKYLAVSEDGLTFAASAEDASVFKVIPDSDSKLQLYCDGKYVTYIADSGENGTFGLSDTSSEHTWLTLIDPAELREPITREASRVGASDIPNGTAVILYLRIWNETELRYEMYAVDHDGSLYPCYARGGKIMWLDDGTDSLQWVFTEYYDEVTKEPNYYYEFYNPYYEHYLAPQLTNPQVISEGKLGVNMPGRRNGEFYSEIIAWDEDRYAYIGMRPNADKTALEPCSQSASYPFYFATTEALNLTDRLHTEATLDNGSFGITMKMQDFGTRAGMSNFLGNDTYASQKTQSGLLSTNLEENGYPTVGKGTNKGKSLNELYTDPNVVNHLFIQSIYNSSGYFEFDSCQNFASFYGIDGELNAPYDYELPDGTIVQATDFTVYRELGTSDSAKPDPASTLQHGQFLPYNKIVAGRYPEKNPYNLYSALASPEAGNENVGKLSEDDPRKYEKLHLIANDEIKDTPNYYNGMELEASFVQTVSGLDSWGHDIIFEFTGDDDFWLYVDGELVIDLGGIHSALEGKVNFRTGVVNSVDKNGNRITTTLREVFTANYQARGLTQTEIDEKLAEYFEDDGTVFKDYSLHTMKIFYMERGAGASNLHMRFNLAAVTPGNVVVSKTVNGEGADMLDTDFIEYPFQIYYTLPEADDGGPGDEKLLGNDDEHIRVIYQNSNAPATFIRRYRPPGVSEEDAYESIYFINPTKNVEIDFPDDTITYRIVECAVNPDIYENVTINGEEVPRDRVEIKGNLKSYSSETGTAEEKPRIEFDNWVNDNVIKDLFFTKKLVDENGDEITDDPATFSFRLRLSAVEVDADAIPLVNMHDYYVLTAEKHMCRYEQGSFVDTGLEYSRAAVKALVASLNDDPTDDEDFVKYNTEHPDRHISSYGLTSPDDITFRTSGFGSISGIPAGYTVCVPGLPVGTVFRITEDVKTGYGLDSYNMETGEKVLDDHSTEQIASYLVYDDNPLNVGQVYAEENPQMLIKNKKGYGLTVNKKWSDLNITTSHAPVYVAVYVDGALLENSVKQIKSPATSAYYFWTTLQPDTDGRERTSLADYKVKEVTITNPAPTVSADGTVTDPGEITPVSAISLAATPIGENASRSFDYIVSVGEGVEKGSARTDTITNIRSGGIALRLFKWDSSDPLANGIFTLKDKNGHTVGTYTSASDGIITMLYDFEPNQLYTLTQTTSPKGYVGMQKSVSFQVTENGAIQTLSLLYDDGTTVWGQNDPKDNAWAKSKAGENGIVAFVDIYNKPFNFKIMKMDAKNTNLMLDGAHFALYKQANTSINGYVKNKSPMTGFEDMVTGDDGIVDVCGGTSGRVINPGVNGSVFFLTEISAPEGYAQLDEDIIFRISALGVPSLIDNSYIGHITETDDSYIYTLDVPNALPDPEGMFFEIEKLIFIDKYVHDSDPSQKFMFKVEWFEATDTELQSAVGSFYVTLNCTEYLDGYPDDHGTLSAGKYTYHYYEGRDSTVTVTYGANGSYTFPTALYRGKQRIKVSEPGIYVVTEMTGWSSTDYDFWEGSNLYLGQENCGERYGDTAVKLNVNSQTMTEKNLIASFTNTETEYAYLSSQAYAENTIKRKAS